MLDVLVREISRMSLPLGTYWRIRPVWCSHSDLAARRCRGSAKYTPICNVRAIVIVSRKFQAVIDRQCIERVWGSRVDQTDKSSVQPPSAVRRCTLPTEGQFAFAIHQTDQGALLMFPDDRIGFPIPDPYFPLDNGRALFSMPTRFLMVPSQISAVSALTVTAFAGNPQVFV